MSRAPELGACEGATLTSVCIFIPTLTAGGAERVSSIIANEWSKRQAVVVLTYFEAPIFFDLDPRVAVFCLGMRPNQGRFRRVLDVLRAGWRMRRFVTRLRPAFVLSFMNKYNAFCLGSLRLAGVPVIVSERDSPREKLPRIREIARDALYPWAAGLIAQTKDGMRFIESRCRLRHVEVIPNPVHRIIDVSERAPEKIVLNVGRLVAKKGQSQLLAAFRQMRATDWRLVFCGDGPLRQALEAQARALGVEDRVEFLGEVTALAPQFRRAGIFAFPSLWEGYPNALAEAMVSGLPCISYDCSTGPSDIIDDGRNGILVPAGDIEALAAALDRLSEDEARARAMGVAASRLSEELDPERIAARYLAFCELAAADRAHT